MLLLCQEVFCASWSPISFVWISMSPMIIRSWCLGSSCVSRSVNWSMKLLLLNCWSVPCGSWCIPIIVYTLDPSCMFQILCSKLELACTSFCCDTLQFFFIMRAMPHPLYLTLTVDTLMFFYCFITDFICCCYLSEIFCVYSILYYCFFVLFLFFLVLLFNLSSWIMLIVLVVDL